MLLHVAPVQPDELPPGKDWIFVEMDGELTVMLNVYASGAAMARGWEVAKGLLLELGERKRLDDIDPHGQAPLPGLPMP